ncbi:MAG: 2-amino-4-hydroxy-6-hydroxymethyldihydropteridine pyrophosphokinase [Rhodothermaceae bacterium]|nr:MAG: 2-amino-4-hydroxy-6-hydroxymethyldihydropteridine pyrophosphokinase [Rhodothermaceae bacterium]
MLVVPPVEAYLALGANLGDRLGTLRWAVTHLASHPAIDVVATSAVYESAAHTWEPGEVQPPYLNAVVHVRTSLSAEDLLTVLLDVEARAGRDRRAARPWAPRPLDLDLIVFGNLTRRTPGLTVPHPRLGERRFVLQPLADLTLNLHVPVPYDSTVRDLLARCPDRGPLTRLPDPLVPHQPAGI